MTYSELGPVNGGPPFMHAQLDLHKRWASARAHAIQLMQVELHAQVCQPTAHAAWFPSHRCQTAKSQKLGTTGLKDANEEMTGMEQILSDKMEKVLKMELQMKDPREWFGKGCSTGFIQNNLLMFLKIKKEIEMINQENDMENVFLLDL